MPEFAVLQLTIKPTFLTLLLLLAPLALACEERPDGPIIVPLGDTGVDLSEVAACDASSSCADPTHVCAGLSVSEAGLCTEDAKHALFSSFVRYSILDNDPQGVESPNVVADIEGAPRHIWVELELTHPLMDELRIELVSPSGERALLHDQTPRSDGVLGFALLDASAFEEEASAAGTWTLVLIDLSAGNIGELQRWSIEITTP